MKPLSPISRPRILSYRLGITSRSSTLAAVTVKATAVPARSMTRWPRKAVEMLLLGRAVAPRRLAPEGPASVAPAGVTDRDRKAVENMNGVAGRKHEVQDPLLDQRQRRALSGEGWVGSEVRKEVPPMPVEVPVDRRVIVTALLFTEDLHRQDLDVGQLRFRAALPQSAAERHPPVGVIDQQVEQDERFFQAASRRPHG